MKRLFQIAALVAVTVFIPISTSMPVAAAPVCEIGYTGPNSENMCISEQQYKCEVTSTNNVTIDYSNEQVAASGNVTVEENGTGGGAVSGSTSNNNTVNFTVEIKNGEEPCFARAVVPATEPEPPVTPETPENPEPGKGETSAPVRPAQEVTPQALPVTSGNPAGPSLVLGASSLVVATAVALAYRRTQL